MTKRPRRPSESPVTDATSPVRTDAVARRRTQAGTARPTASPEAGRLFAVIARDLASRIASGEYLVGQRLPSERDLAALYGVSRPTVRETVLALAHEGLIEVRTGSGAYVKTPALKTPLPAEVEVGAFQLLECRRAIEGETCALAALRITEAELDQLDALAAEMSDAAVPLPRAEEADRLFHKLIAEATRNAPLANAVEVLWEARSRSLQTQLLSARAGAGPRPDDHRAIIAALRSRSPDAARAAMRTHLGQVLESLLSADESQRLDLARAEVAEERRFFLG